MNLPSVWIPDTALDGPNLITASDLVISAGGTMNREAAVREWNSRLRGNVTAISQSRRRGLVPNSLGTRIGGINKLEIMWSSHFFPITPSALRFQKII